MRPLLVVCALLALPSPALASSWTGSWANDAVGTRGPAHLAAGRSATLRLGGAALGCAQPVVLAVRYTHGRVSGSGRDLPCNRGLRWQLSGPPGAAMLRVRLPDGTRAELKLELRRR